MECHQNHTPPSSVGVRYRQNGWQIRYKVFGKAYCCTLPNTANTPTGRQLAQEVRQKKIQATREAFRPGLNIPSEFDPTSHETERFLMTARVAQTMLTEARRRAYKRNIPFSLSIQEIGLLWETSAGRCAITGVLFSHRYSATGRNSPFRPSIDRIANQQGYTLENCRLVSWFANNAVADWPDAVLVLAFQTWAHNQGYVKVDCCPPSEKNP